MNGLTDRGLVTEGPNPTIGGVRRLYDIGKGYGLSAINSPLAHSYRYAWEIAVLGPDGAITYDTPLTEEVEVFHTDDEANAFIENAFTWAESLKGDEAA